MSSNKSVNRLFFVTVILYLGVSLLVGRLAAARLSTNAALVLSEALILIPALIYCLVKKISVRELIPFKKMKFSVWILVIVCTYLMYPLLIVLNAVTLFFVESGTVELVDMVTDESLFIAALLMAVMPAFCEEFVFRGILFGTYKRSKMLPAIFLSAFLFGCMHMNFNQFLYAFALGIYMAFLVEATGSILSSMLAHFVINFTSVLMSYALPALQGVMNSASGAAGQDMQLPPQTGNFLATLDTTSLLLVVIGVAFWAMIAVGTTAGAAGVYVGISKLSNRWEHVKGMLHEGSGQRLITVSVVAAIAVMAAVMIYKAAA